MMMPICAGRFRASMRSIVSSTAEVSCGPRLGNRLKGMVEISWTPARSSALDSQMIGAKVTLRLRMSAHDAHYAGELVDGARMLALFGDLATELLIRLDGDEGLFRAYESVEFLAPVFAGDYIEASAELVAIGA